MKREEARTTVLILQMGKMKCKAIELTSGQVRGPGKILKQDTKAAYIASMKEAINIYASFLLSFRGLRLNFSLSRRFSFPLICFGAS